MSSWTPLGRDAFRFRACVYSRHAVCITSDPSSIVMKNCRFPISYKKPASEHSFDNIRSSRSASNLRSYSCNKSHRANDVELWDMALALGISVGITKDSQVSPSTWCLESGSNSVHKSATAPLMLSWLTEITVRRINLTVSSHPLKWMDFFPPPLLFNSPLSKALVARNTGCPLSAKLSMMTSAVLFHSPCGLLTRVPYHFLTTTSQKWPTSVLELLGICCNIHWIRHTISMISLCSHTMSLFVDMKMILPLNGSGSHFDSVIVFWISKRNFRCFESLGIFPLEFHRISVDPIQIFEMARLQKPFNCLSKLQLVYRWSFPDRTPSRQRRMFGFFALWTTLSHIRGYPLRISWSQSIVDKPVISTWYMINLSIVWISCLTDFNGWFLVDLDFRKILHKMKWSLKSKSHKYTPYCCIHTEVIQIICWTSTISLSYNREDFLHVKYTVCWYMEMMWPNSTFGFRVFWDSWSSWVSWISCVSWVYRFPCTDWLRVIQRFLVCFCCDNFPCTDVQ